MAKFIKKNITPTPNLYPIQNNAQSIQTKPTIKTTNEQLIFGKYKANLAITETDLIEYRNETCVLKLLYPRPKAPYSNLDMKEGFRDWKVYEYSKSNDFNQDKNIAIYYPVSFDLHVQIYNKSVEELHAYSLKISCSKISGNPSLEEYYQSISSRNVEILYTNKLFETEIGGQKAYYIEYKTSESNSWLYKKVIFVRNDFAYTLTEGLYGNPNYISKVISSIGFIEK